MQLINFNLLLYMLLALVSCKDESQQTKTTPVVQNTFKNPLLNSAPDPWIIRSGEWYYVTHTTGYNLRLYRTKKIEDLSKAESKVVWTAPASGMNARNIWAPELHRINDKWYLYYAADDGENSHHRIWVIENASSDPFEGTWTDKGKVQLPEDRWAIDANLFMHNAQLYCLWSGWEGTENVRQVIYISKMENPWTASGDRVMISKPEYDWEMRGGTPSVNEAPQFMRHNDKLFVVYSASGCWTDDYALGMLSASTTADLLDASSWTKSSSPVFQKNPSALAYGPGHNCFFSSPDSTESWIAYHANNNSGDGCGNKRSLRIQKFSWNLNGLPDFGVPVEIGKPLTIPSNPK
jgi:GH43 family beta-xylosidase